MTSKPSAIITLNAGAPDHIKSRVREVLNEPGAWAQICGTMAPAHHGKGPRPSHKKPEVH